MTPPDAVSGAATPEAQIPEDRLRQIMDAGDMWCGTDEAQPMAKELLSLRSQLAALRVERDQALESLRGYREHHATYGSCRIELTGDHRCKDCRRADSALLARPIPAEPSHE